MTLLKGKTVLVTGASGGIGAEICRIFDKQGANIVLHYHNGITRANKLAKELNNKSLLVQADLASEADVANLFMRITAEARGPDILVANAGIWVKEDIPIHKMTLKQWQNTMNTNLTSIFLCMREFLKSVVANKLKAPSAVIIGSTAGIFGEAGHADYAASKAAAIYGFMKSLKNEICHLAPQGRINAVCPSWTATPMVAEFAANKKNTARVLQTVPLRKLASPHDVAQATLFLACEKLSGHTSGQIIEVSGGMEGRVLYEKKEIK